MFGFLTDFLTCLGRNFFFQIDFSILLWAGHNKPHGHFMSTLVFCKLHWCQNDFSFHIFFIYIHNSADYYCIVTQFLASSSTFPTLIDRKTKHIPKGPNPILLFPGNQGWVTLSRHFLINQVQLVARKGASRRGGINGENPLITWGCNWEFL